MSTMLDLDGDVPAPAPTAAAGGSGDDNFCDASIPADRAEGFALWAKRRARFPPRPGEMLSLRCTDQLGTHMVAKKTFEVGDLILSEKALLHVPAPRPEAQRELRRFAGQGPFLGPALAVDWKAVPEDAFEAALNLFWAHPLMCGESKGMLPATTKACADLLEMHDALRRRFDATTLLRFLHVVDLNIHRDDEADHDAFAGIFVLGSKFSNSCASNCKWAFSSDGYLEYRAIRRILPGDVFSFSYIGNGMSLVEGTVARQRRLGSLWFICQCSRCSSPDLSRQMRCPKCGSSQCLPLYKHFGSMPDWTGQAALRELIPEAASWRCQACKEELPASRMPLREEEAIAAAVPEILSGAVENAPQDRRMAWDLADQAAKDIGPLHWTWMLATFAWLQKCWAELQNFDTISFTEQEVREANVAIARWFETCLPDNVEQRLSALCLAARLAGCFGADLKSFGYDPEDPIGDGSGIARELAARSVPRVPTIRHTGPSGKPPSRLMRAEWH